MKKVDIFTIINEKYLSIKKFEIHLINYQNLSKLLSCR